MKDKHAPKPHAVYRCFSSDGRLLYIGCSMSPLARTEAHALGQPWALAIASLTLEWHPNKTAARDAESSAIAAEQPEWNVHHRPEPKRAIGRLNASFNAQDPSTWQVPTSRYPFPKSEGTQA